MSKLKAFVLCAGKGERLWPFSTLLPKCLWPIGGKPCARIIVDQVRSAGIGEVYVCCLEKDRTLFEHEFRDVDVGIIATNEPKGTAGQVPLHMVLDGDFIIHYGDCLVNVDHDAIYQDFFARRKVTPIVGMLVMTSYAKSEFGKATMNANPGQIQNFEEKPVLNDPTWTGVAVLSPDVAHYVEEGKDFAHDIFPKMINEGKPLYGYTIDEPYWDIGSIAAYRAVNAIAEQGRLFK